MTTADSSFPNNRLPAAYDIRDKEFLHLMYTAVRIQSEGLASCELMKWLSVKVEDNLGSRFEKIT
jgi:hypothetical protein